MKRIILISWLLMLLCSTSYAGVASPKALVEHGVAYLQQENNVAAIKHFEAALMMGYSDPRLHYQLGLAYYNYGVSHYRIEEIEIAQRIWQRLVDEKQIDGMLLSTIIDIIERAERRKDRVKEELAIKVAYEKDHSNVEVGLKYADLLKGRDRHAQARNVYQVLIDNNPNDAQPFIELAKQVNSEGRKLWAESYYRSALRVDPKNQVAQQGLQDLLDYMSALSEEGYESFLSSAH